MVVVWRITERCNLSCKFCGYDRELARPRKEADPQLVHSLAAVLADYQRATGDSVLVSWLGGEPLLWAPLTDLSRTFRQNYGLRISTTTNGTCLASTKIRAHLLEYYSELTVSVDALGPLHDRLRGWPGGFSRLERNITDLAEQKRRQGHGPILRANVLLMRVRYRSSGRQKLNPPESVTGTSTEFYQADEERIRETLRLLAAPRLLAQPHLVLASETCASMIPCKGVDMLLARTSARTPLKFPLRLPVGMFDILEQPQGLSDNDSAAIDDHQDPGLGQARRHTSQVQIHTLGGWRVTLRAVAVIHGNLQDERQLFAHLPEVPVIPFRLEEGGIGLINTSNITRATAWPKPAALPGTALPLALRGWKPSLQRGGKPAMASSFGR